MDQITYECCVRMANDLENCPWQDCNELLQEIAQILIRRGFLGLDGDTIRREYKYETVDI